MIIRELTILIMGSNMKVMLNRHKYWILVSLTYLTLFVSTSLHHFYGVERTVSLSYYVESEESLKEYFPDMGLLKGQPVDTYWRKVWKLSSFSLDVQYYLIHSAGINQGIPPYKYRILPVLIVRAISSILQISKEMSFVLMNLLVVYLTALLFNLYLMKDFNFSKMGSFIGGILFVTMASVTGTLPFPMLDPISLLFSMLIFISVIRRNPYIFILSSIAGVLSKEVLVIFSLMWFLETIQLRNKRKLLKNIIISILPIIAFISIRIALGGAAFEVEYGHNILKGEFPDLIKRLVDPGEIFYAFRRTFLTFSFVWFGIVNVGKHDFFKRQIIIVPIVILATIVLSAQITRPLGILFPLVIPMFLMFFEENTKTNHEKC